MRINDSTIYLTDNGAALCGEHLGYTAKTTGMDLSGQEILPITPEIAKQAHVEMGFAPACERCGKTPSFLHTAGV